MCVRYSVEPAKVSLALEVEVESTMDTPDVYPGYPAPILLPQAEGGFGVVSATWGLQPPWAKEANFGRKNAYNARAETVAEKPSFRDPFRKRRCIVPATAFYERRKGRWVRLVPVEREVLAIAGLFELPNALADGTTYTMVTTEPNALISDVQDRMPVILDREGMELWLAGDAKVGELARLLSPCPDEWLTMEDAGPISRRPKANEGGDEPSLF